MSAIDYYFSCSSPFTYLGNAPFRALAEKHGCAVNVKPVNIFTIWEQSGAVPPQKRPLIRQRLRLIELQRIALHLGVPINKKPKFHPVDPTLCDCIIIALTQEGADPWPFMQAAFETVWVNEGNIAEETTLSGLLGDLGHDSAALVEKARTGDIIERREQNSLDAIAADAPGVPSYVLNGECFWGQDRLDLLDEALTSGREPFQP
ncbi:MAG: 2-hydroxychromene-2-carboxylate isomerase [Pseudomonadota bacterium]